ncbi:hypothetical protein BDF19DRAFT_429201 [Syncephalis fuscata]|nr:hypothetical protein BDF19DRAFT_429201 [Syncephalis fuscata]
MHSRLLKTAGQRAYWAIRELDRPRSCLTVLRRCYGHESASIRTPPPPPTTTTTTTSTAERLRIKTKIAAIDETRPYAAPELKDLHQRQHTYLRISLTERCNLRCTYCMPAEGVPLTSSEKLLTPDELQRLARLFVSAGVTKIRLTGGEPTVRKDIIEIVEGLNQLRPLGLQSIGMTSNGIALKRKLPALVANGLNVLNVSLDTLDPFKFEIMTRRRGMERVLESVDEAIKVGVPRVKMNCVVVRGINDAEVLDFVELTKSQPIDMRFIEYMPFGGNRWEQKKLVPYQELLDIIQERHGSVEKLTDDPNDTSKAFRIPGYTGQIGFITSMSDHFCGTCNRLRITADGNLKVCLFGNEEVSLRDKMRQGESDEQLLASIGVGVKRKRAQHAGMATLAKSDNRPMILIDGQHYYNSNSLSSRTNIQQSYLPSTALFTSLSYKKLFVSQQLLPALHSVPSYAPTTTLRSFSTTASTMMADDQAESNVDKDAWPQQHLTHIDPNSGRAAMVDVSDKLITKRTARASARVHLGATAYRLVADNTKNAKGDVLAVAQLAGIQAAKRTADLIPLCHPLQLSHVSVDLALDHECRQVNIMASVTCTGKTGVEMEALTAASVAALTVFDMCKAADKAILIDSIRVIEKKGGKSGHYQATV